MLSKRRGQRGGGQHKTEQKKTLTSTYAPGLSHPEWPLPPCPGLWEVGALSLGICHPRTEEGRPRNTSHATEGREWLATTFHIQEDV
jgi:hypothetical protein